MKIIDFEKKGNVVRFYLGDNDLKEWYGDDSTPEKIVITPHEEWEIGKILIDGEEIEITEELLMEHIDDYRQLINYCDYSKNSE